MKIYIASVADGNSRDYNISYFVSQSREDVINQVKTCYSMKPEVQEMDVDSLLWDRNLYFDITETELIIEEGSL